MFNGAKLAKLIREAGMSQRDFAKRLTEALGGRSVQQSTVSRWVSGDQTPHPNTILAIAAIFGLQVSDLNAEPDAIRNAETTESVAMFSDQTERSQLNDLAFKLLRRLAAADGDGCTIQLVKDGKVIEPFEILRSFLKGESPFAIQFVKDGKTTQLEFLL